jgi:5-methylcytosine-specific restriction enzyme A
MKIPNDLIPEVYVLSKQVFEGHLSLKDAKSLIARDNRINPSSAADFFVNFRHFRRGERYTRTNNAFTTDYFLNHINQDYGIIELGKAVKALKLHIEYFENHQKVTMHELRKIEKKYSELITENPDEIEQNEIIKDYQLKNKSKEDIAKELNKLKPTDPELIDIKGRTYKRDNKTIAQIKVLRDFKCQICSTSIRKKDGTLYVEAAHITAKHNKGLETPDNILLLCPNHHKEFDFGDLTIHFQDKNSVHFTLNGQNYKLETGTTY